MFEKGEKQWDGMRRKMEKEKKRMKEVGKQRKKLQLAEKQRNRVSYA